MLAGVVFLLFPWIEHPSGDGLVEIRHFPLVAWILGTFFCWIGSVIVVEALAEPGTTRGKSILVTTTMSLLGALAIAGGIVVTVKPLLWAGKLVFDWAVTTLGVFLIVASLLLRPGEATLRKERRRLIVELSDHERAKRFLEESRMEARVFRKKVAAWSDGDDAASAATAYLKTLAARGALGNVLEQATAFMGELLCREANGAWLLKPRQPPVIQLGEGLTSHELDPLELVFLVATEKHETFEGILGFELEEFAPTKVNERED